MTTGAYRHCDEMVASHHAADIIVPLILQLTGPLESVADVGGGDGGWLRAFQRHGCKDVVLFDSPDVRPHLRVSTESFHPVDLLRDDLPMRRCDLAVCLECAEHLPSERAEWLVRSLTSMSDVVLFSAAVPGQGGKGHINEQPHAYWSERFMDRGFRRFDLVRGRIVHDRSIPWWYRQNMFLYAADGAAPFGDAAAFLPDEMCLVHRDVLTRMLTCGVRQRVRLLLGDLRQAIFRRRLR